MEASNVVSVENDQSLPDAVRVAREVALAQRIADADTSERNLRNYSTETLRVLYDAADDAAFYTHGGVRFVSLEKRAFDELANRGEAKKRDIQQMFEKFVAARDFESARVLRSRFPETDLSSLPRIVIRPDIGRTHRVYAIAADSQTATLLHLPVERGPKIIVSVLNGCPVATRAFRALNSHPDLRRRLKDDGMILTFGFEPDAVVREDSVWGPARTYVAYRQSDWPDIDFSFSPTFYFLRDGKIVYHFAAWKAGGESLEKFRRGLESIGLGGS